MWYITNSAPEQAEALAAIDGHLSARHLRSKAGAEEVLHAETEGKIVGILRYNLFWDQIPFLTLIRVLPRYQRKGIGTSLLSAWEQAMSRLGHTQVLTSTQADEDAQFFYRRLGYRDIGGFVLPAEPLEIVLIKSIAQQGAHLDAFGVE
jgi:ribosomal protein S18 acetylase RimI-like enzyme